MERFNTIFLKLQLPVMKISVSKNRHFPYKSIVHYKYIKLYNRLITFTRVNALYI